MIMFALQNQVVLVVVVSTDLSKLVEVLIVLLLVLLVLVLVILVLVDLRHKSLRLTDGPVPVEWAMGWMSRAMCQSSVAWH